MVLAESEEKMLRYAKTKLTVLTRNPSPHYVQQGYRSALIPITSTWTVFVSRPNEGLAGVVEKLNSFVRAQVEAQA